MASFSYRAINNDDKMIQGTLESINREMAVEELVKQGLKILEITQLKDTDSNKRRHGKIKLNDLVLFTRQLATMVSAGVPLMRALATLQAQSDNPAMKEIIGAIVKDVEGGSQLADALEKHPEVFSDIYVNMVRAGESAGIVDDILKRLAAQVEKSASMRKKIKGAMAYPMVLLGIMVVAFFGIMLFIMPQIGGILKGLGGPDAELPFLTQTMLDMSDFMVQQWWVVALVLSIIIYAFRRFIKTPGGKRKWHSLILKLPVAGLLTQKIAVASFTRTFSALIGAGVSMVEALNVTSRSLGNVLFQEELQTAAQGVINGKQLSEALTGSTLFPAIVPQMLAVGEETGQTDVVLVKVAEFYEEEVDTLIESLSSLLEPIMIVVLGGGVGLIAISVMGPIASLSTSVN